MPEELAFLLQVSYNWQWCRPQCKPNFSHLPKVYMLHTELLLHNFSQAVRARAKPNSSLSNAELPALLQ